MNLLKTNSFIFVCFIVLAVYFPILCVPTANPDATIILDNLNSFTHFFNYLYGLIEFKTIDFQPIRDFSLLLDLLIMRHLNTFSFILQNTIWWIFSCYIIWKILLSLFPERNKHLLFTFLIIFSIYPLFAQSIGWGMARKHLMAFFFILLSIQEVISHSIFSKKSSFKICLFYSLSLFSQPIHLFWPIWASLYLYAIKKENHKKISVLLLPTFIMMILCGIINYYYYNKSEIFLKHYPAKNFNTYQIFDSFITLGHSFFQQTFPFQLSLYYDRGDAYSLVGLILYGAFLVWIFLNKNLRSELFIWHALGILSLITVMTSSSVLYDTYLLLPTFSLFIILMRALNFPKNNKFLILIILFFSFFTFQQSKNWSNSLQLIRSSYQSRPSCRTALRYLQINYEDYRPAPLELKNYIQENACLKNSSFTSYSATTYTVMLANILYHEEDAPQEDRIKALMNLNRKSIIPKLTLAALFLKKNNQAEADKILEDLILNKDKIVFQGKEYHAITAKILHPYCLTKKWKDCLKITSMLIFPNENSL